MPVKARVMDRPVLRWGARVAYGLFTSFSGVALAFLIVLGAGPHFGNGESWQALALGWWVFGIPIALGLGAALAAVVYPFYARLKTWPTRGATYASTVLVIAAVVLWAAAWSAGI